MYRLASDFRKLAKLTAVQQRIYIQPNKYTSIVSQSNEHKYIVDRILKKIQRLASQGVFHAYVDPNDALWTIPEIRLYFLESGFLLDNHTISWKDEKSELREML